MQHQVSCQARWTPSKKQEINLWYLKPRKIGGYLLALQPCYRWKQTKGEAIYLFIIIPVTSRNPLQHPLISVWGIRGQKLWVLWPQSFPAYSLSPPWPVSSIGFAWRSCATAEWSPYFSCSESLRLNPGKHEYYAHNSKWEPGNPNSSLWDPLGALKQQSRQGWGWGGWGV